MSRFNKERAVPILGLRTNSYSEISKGLLFGRPEIDCDISDVHRLKG